MTAHEALRVVVATAHLRADAGDEPLVAIRAAMNAVPLAVLVANDNGHYIRANAAASALTGYSVAELRRLFVWDLTPNTSKDEFEPLWRAFLVQREQHGQYQLATKSGRVLTADYAARARVLPHLHVSVLRLLSHRRTGRRA